MSLQGREFKVSLSETTLEEYLQARIYELKFLLANQTEVAN